MDALKKRKFNVESLSIFFIKHTTIISILTNFLTLLLFKLLTKERKLYLLEPSKTDFIKIVFRTSKYMVRGKLCNKDHVDVNKTNLTLLSAIRINRKDNLIFVSYNLLDSN